MRPITEIIIHATATRPEWWAGRPTKDKVAEIRRWHVQDRGWKNIGYHYLIDRDGTVAEGRPLDQVGAHVQGHNAGTVGIALFGGHGSAETDDFAENFTPEQDRALRAQIQWLRQEYPTIRKVSGHNFYARKACPGFNVMKWFTSTPGKIPVSVPDGLAPLTGHGNSWWALFLKLIGVGK